MKKCDRGIRIAPNGSEQQLGSLHVSRSAKEAGNTTDGTEGREPERLMDPSRGEEIRHRASEIYLARVEEHGRDIEHWLHWGR